MPPNNKWSKFQEIWLTDPQYKDWLRRVPKDEYQYFCTLCNCENSCASMGRSSLENHIDTFKHKLLYEKLIQGRAKGLFSFGFQKKMVQIMSQLRQLMMFQREPLLVQMINLYNLVWVIKMCKIQFLVELLIKKLWIKLKYYGFCMWSIKISA